MTLKDQARAIKLLRRWGVYSEDWKSEGPGAMPNGVKLREETRAFLNHADEDDDEEEKPEAKKA